MEGLEIESDLPRIAHSPRPLKTPDLELIIEGLEASDLSNSEYPPPPILLALELFMEGLETSDLINPESPLPQVERERWIYVETSLHIGGYHLV